MPNRWKEHGDRVLDNIQIDGDEHCFRMILSGLESEPGVMVSEELSLVLEPF